MAKKILLAALVFCFAAASPVWAGDCSPESTKTGGMCPCQGGWYAQGASVCVKGHQFTCVDGKWKNDGKACQGQDCCARDICNDNPEACKKLLLFK